MQTKPIYMRVMLPFLLFDLIVDMRILWATMQPINMIKNDIPKSRKLII